MKKILTLLVLLICSTFLFGQIKYLKGYFIDDNNGRTECFIKSVDPMNNPYEFDYKITLDGKSEKGNISGNKEFGIDGVVRYLRVTLKIDRSPWKLESLSKDKDPEWSEETLFLKVLIEGKASLYHFKEGSLDRFFYSVDNLPISQLIYKQYQVNQSQTAYNNKFRQQLASDVIISNAQMNQLASLTYNKNALVKYFENYNKASGQTILQYGSGEKKNLFHLKLTPGVGSSSLIFQNRVSSTTQFDFGTKIFPRIGAEFEFVLPWYMKSWSVVFEPTFQYFSANSSKENSASNINYSSVEVPLGLRHYHFLKNDMKIFVDGFFFYNSPVLLKSDLFLSNAYLPTYKIQPSLNFAFGAGFQYKRFSLETRYNTNKNIMLNDHGWKTGYTKLEVILGIAVL